MASGDNPRASGRSALLIARKSGPSPIPPALIHATSRRAALPFNTSRGVLPCEVVLVSIIFSHIRPCFSKSSRDISSRRNPTISDRLRPPDAQPTARIARSRTPRRDGPQASSSASSTSRVIGRADLGAWGRAGQRFSKSRLDQGFGRHPGRVIRVRIPQITRMIQ